MAQRMKMVRIARPTIASLFLRRWRQTCLHSESFFGVASLLLPSILAVPLNKALLSLPCPVSDPGIEKSIDDINDKIYKDKEYSQQQNRSLHYRVIAGQNRINH